jgi:hypothetical protein
MTVIGTDVSRWQPDWHPAPDDKFVIVKATQGTTIRNAERDEQLQRGRAASLLVGHYHYLERGNAEAQARHFLSSTDIQVGDTLWCDWEGDWSAGKHPSVEDAAAFIAAVKKAKPANKVGLYCNASDWRSTAVKKGDALWVAHYGVAKPGIQQPWDLHQYTDDPIDKNRSSLATLAELRAWWTSPPAGYVPPPSDVGDWMVNPDKVTTHLRGRDKAGVVVTELKPGTVITDGIAFAPNWLGRVALWTAAGVSYDREFLTQVAPGPVPVPETPTRPLPVIPEYDGTERLRFRGRRVCICVATSLPFVEHRMLEEGVIQFNIDIYQGGYNTTVAASAGTHDEGGNTDVGQYSFAALKIWREMGWAMQHRTKAQGYGWPVGCPHLSEGAEWQASEWNLYRNGLRSRGRVTGPSPTGKLTPTWVDGLMAYKARFVSTTAMGLPMPENFDDGTDPKEQV